MDPLGGLDGLVLDPPQQLLAGGDVVDQADDLAGGPDAKVLVAVDEDLAAPLARHERGDLLELARGAGLFDPHGLGGDLVLEQAGGVCPAAQDELGVVLRSVDDGLLDVVVDRSLGGAHEPRPHVDALGAEGERGRQPLAVGEATGRDKGDLEGLAGPREEDEVGDVRLAHVAGALETVDGQEVDTQLDGRLGVADRGALVEDDDPRGLEEFDDGPGGVSRGFHHLDPFVYADLRVFTVGRGVHGREEGDVDAKRVLGHGSASSDLLA